MKKGKKTVKETKGTIGPKARTVAERIRRHYVALDEMNALAGEAPRAVDLVKQHSHMPPAPTMQKIVIMHHAPPCKYMSDKIHKSFREKLLAGNRERYQWVDEWLEARRLAIHAGKFVLCQGSLQVACPECGFKFSASPLRMGRTAECPMCGTIRHWEYLKAACQIKKETWRPKIHWVKILPQYFTALATGKKRFEIRKNDRDYRVNDHIIFQMWTLDKGLWGKNLPMRITYITAYPDGLRPGYVVLGVKPL